MFAINQNYDSIDGELIRKARKTCDKITESIYVTANEPTLACYRIEEHIHRSVPVLAQKKDEMIRNESILKGLLYDIEYTKDSIESLSGSKDSLDNIQRLLKDSIYFKQQADYDENVRRRVQEKLRNTISTELLPSSPHQPKNDLKSETSSKSTANDASQQKQSTHRIRISNSNRFNRFSTSFDFSHSLPMVASSVSADLRSLINQFTSKDSGINNQQNIVSDNGQKPNTVTTSKSLYTLQENLNLTEDENSQTTNSQSKKPEE
ncbi:uncharacterized protein LOC124490543 [Dermatophagoides farinae]|uniref:uncharacterized protein LOC124490543 n=1 Tax=Dermatophagoides farinae TaxID=6954 RepID=UPI003F62B523